MNDQLHDCPYCGRKNFTTAGLRAHHCKGPGLFTRSIQPEPSQISNLKSDCPSDSLEILVPDKPTPSKKPQSALAILESPQIGTTGADLETLGRRAAEELAEIDRLQTSAALRAILFGLVMYQAKAALDHGQFVPWQNKYLSKSRKQCNFYMRLALAYVESTRTQLPDLLNLTQLSLDLTPTSADQEQSLTRARQFVAGKSLNELLQEHNIKSPPKPRTPSTSPRKDRDAEPILTPAQIAEAKEALFHEVEASVSALRELLLGPSSLAPTLFEPVEWTAISESLITLGREAKP
jgi:hypothetical protein